MEHIIVAYDISDDKRRGKVRDILENYGIRVQYSLFECRLKPDDVLKLKFYLKNLINKEEDRIHFYRLCLDCYGKIERIGTDKPITDKETIVI